MFTVTAADYFPAQNIEFLVNFILKLTKLFQTAKVTVLINFKWINLIFVLL